MLNSFFTYLAKPTVSFKELPDIPSQWEHDFYTQIKHQYLHRLEIAARVLSIVAFILLLAISSVSWLRYSLLADFDVTPLSPGSLLLLLVINSYLCMASFLVVLDKRKHRFQDRRRDHRIATLTSNLLILGFHGYIFLLFFLTWTKMSINTPYIMGMFMYIVIFYFPSKLNLMGYYLGYTSYFAVLIMYPQSFPYQLSALLSGAILCVIGWLTGRLLLRHQANTFLKSKALEVQAEELCQALEQLQEAQEVLIQSRKMAALGQMVAGVAHEVNTPLGCAITSASHLAESTTTIKASYSHNTLKRSTLNHYFEIAEQSSQLVLENLHRTSTLIQNFKLVSADHTALDPECFDINTHLQTLLSTLETKATDVHYTLDFVPTDPLLIKSYPEAFTQVVTNLVTNSLNHAYQPGAQGHLCLQVSRDSRYLYLDYADDGCGIPADHLPKLFDPFFTTARHSGSVGLGLHIVFNIVTQTLQGSIQVDSTVGHGTTFHLVIPLT